MRLPVAIRVTRKDIAQTGCGLFATSRHRDLNLSRLGTLSPCDRNVPDEWLFGFQGSREGKTPLTYFHSWRGFRAVIYPKFFEDFFLR